MAFKQKMDLDDVTTTVTIGGTNKKSGKANPKSVTGYFLGTKNTGPNKYNKTKDNLLHVLQTATGVTGVWGKSNMDKKLRDVVPGTMIRVTYTGEKDVGKGNPMQCFSVEVDEEDTIEVQGFPNNESTNDGSNEADDFEETSLDSEEEALDEVAPARTFTKPTANSVDAARQAKVAALLAGKGKAKTA